MSEAEINSKDYWERRFKEDWDSNMGQEQSRFFGTLAVDAMPPWLARTIRAEHWSICDWGCAKGDGTKVLMETFPESQIVGVDFSQAAVETARGRYGEGFSAEDWLDGSVEKDDHSESWDLVFSSNTLEHFPDPDRVLRRLCERALQCVTLLVPYRELDRHPEHATTFLPENILFTPFPGFALCYTRTINASLAEPSYWGGEQVLLVYLRQEVAARLGLTAEQSVVDLGERIARLDGELAECLNHADDLAREVRSQFEISAKLANQLKEQDALNQELAIEVRRLASRLTQARKNPLRLWLPLPPGSEG